MNNFMATSKKKGIAYIVRDTAESPGGQCDSPKCPLANPSIKTGMTCVKYGGKIYHGSCAKYQDIEYKIPRVETKKRVD